MRFKWIVRLFLAASLLPFAGASRAQSPAGNEPPPSSAESGGPQEVARPVPAWRQGSPVVRVASRARERPDEEERNPLRALQVFSRLEGALDNPGVRMALGLTDQQADSLRKIIVDTEIFTIHTGASAAVDAIQLRELLRADHPDRAAVMAKGDELSKSTSQLIDRYLDAVLSAKTILTPEQQKMIRLYLEGAGGSHRSPLPRP